MFALRCCKIPTPGVSTRYDTLVSPSNVISRYWRRIAGHHDDIVDFAWAPNSQFYASCSKARNVMENPGHFRESQRWWRMWIGCLFWKGLNVSIWGVERFPRWEWRISCWIENTLPETNISPESWMVGILTTLLLGPGTCSGAFAVSFGGWVDVNWPGGCQRLVFAEWGRKPHTPTSTRMY